MSSAETVKQNRQSRRWREKDNRDWWSEELIQELPPRVFTKGTPACRDMETSMFYNKNTALALAVCRTCPVRVECLTWALENGDINGVQAVTASDRRAFMGMPAAKLIRHTDKLRGF